MSPPGCQANDQSYWFQADGLTKAHAVFNLNPAAKLPSRAASRRACGDNIYVAQLNQRLPHFWRRNTDGGPSLPATPLLPPGTSGLRAPFINRFRIFCSNATAT